MLPQDQLVGLANKVLPKLHEGGANDVSVASAGDVQLRQLCRLWAGMGHIYLATIIAGKKQFVIKHVTPPSPNRQSFGDRRKAQSYQVESNFYEHLAATLQSDFDLQLPTPYAVEHGPAQDEITICMSHLQGSGVNVYDSSQVRKTLTWLAKFHAAYWCNNNNINKKNDDDDDDDENSNNNTIDNLVERVGLQRNGGYWHLDTRPDEHDNMPHRGWEGRLKRAARAIDSCMKRDSMQCLIHGDPKDANIMLLDGRSSSNSSSNHQEVAMYDFQYCGKGTPTRDLTYFLCSSCNDDDEEELVQYYYQQLVEHLEDGITPPTLEHFQQSLELAYADYCRFMAGWGYWGFSIQGRVKRFLDELDGGKDLGSEEAYDEAIRKKLW
jgi:hypothetical protein